MTKRGATRGSEDASHEGRITVKDNRRIDPATGEVRQTADTAAGAAAEGMTSSPGVGDSGGASNPSPDAAARGADPGAGPQTAELHAQLAERTADLQRMTAEYANYRKRADRDKQAATLLGKAAVVAELLAVLDDLDRADEHGDLTGGFKTVADKLIDVLTKSGLERYGADGDAFDPNIHEAVQFATSADVSEPTITAVLRPGYLFDERVLRAAVVVVTGPEHDGAAVADADADSHGAEAGPGGQDAAASE